MYFGNHDITARPVAAVTISRTVYGNAIVFVSLKRTASSVTSTPSDNSVMMYYNVIALIAFIATLSAAAAENMTGTWDLLLSIS